MFNYASTILSHFSNLVPSAKVHSIYSFRIDIEDYIYILETEDGAFVLYETDYMFDVTEAVDMLKTTAIENNYTYLKLLNPDQFGKDSRILRIEGNSRIYLAATINVNEHHVRIDPARYGGSAPTG